jgi:hypothetical protein
MCRIEFPAFSLLSLVLQILFPVRAFDTGYFVLVLLHLDRWKSKFCFSETELMNMMEPWDDKINLNSKSLEFDFTDSPVNRKKVAGEISKSPWSQGFSHPKRDDLLTSNLFNWLAASTSDELVSYFTNNFTSSKFWGSLM